MNEKVLRSIPEHVREALIAILDYLADEEEHFEADPASTDHICLSVKAVGVWLDYEPGTHAEARAREEDFLARYGENMEQEVRQTLRLYGVDPDGLSRGEGLACLKEEAICDDFWEIVQTVLHGRPSPRTNYPVLRKPGDPKMVVIGTSR
jgi:hypothetical protein